MSITPDETRQISTTRCSGCGKELHVNQKAIVFDAMADAPLLLGDCCADRVIGALIQDAADALSKHSNTYPSYWITQTNPERMRRVADKARQISDEYHDAILGLNDLGGCSGNPDKTPGSEQD
jgi:hypothetical protein